MLGCEHWATVLPGRICLRRGSKQSTVQRLQNACHACSMLLLHWCWEVSCSATHHSRAASFTLQLVAADSTAQPMVAEFASLQLVTGDVAVQRPGIDV